MFTKESSARVKYSLNINEGDAKNENYYSNDNKIILKKKGAWSKLFS